MLISAIRFKLHLRLISTFQKTDVDALTWLRIIFKKWGELSYNAALVVAHILDFFQMCEQISHLKLYPSVFSVLKETLVF